MRRNKRWVLGLGLVGLLALTGTAQAALIDQDNGTVLDTNTNLLWLKDLNGAANWDAQMAWANGLDVGGRNDWRLPELSEYQGLFNDYGSFTSNSPPFDFESVPDTARFWSRTEASSGFASAIRNDGLAIASITKNSDLFAVAVTPVPLPAAGWLFLSALGAMGGLAWRRKQGAA